MAIATVNITGKVLKPDGNGMPGGTIEIKLDQYGAISDGAADHVIGPGSKLTVVVASDGSVDFNIMPNSGTGSITPPGTKWNAKFTSNDGVSWPRQWSVAAAPTSQDIGDL